MVIVGKNALIEQFCIIYTQTLEITGIRAAAVVTAETAK